MITTIKWNDPKLVVPSDNRDVIIFYYKKGSGRILDNSLSRITTGSYDGEYNSWTLYDIHDVKLYDIICIEQWLSKFSIALLGWAELPALQDMKNE